MYTPTRSPAQGDIKRKFYTLKEFAKQWTHLAQLMQYEKQFISTPNKTNGYAKIVEMHDRRLISDVWTKFGIPVTQTAVPEIKTLT